jgi:hypothetical protein
LEKLSRHGALGGTRGLAESRIGGLATRHHLVDWRNGGRKSRETGPTGQRDYVAPITLEHLDPQGTLEYETRLVAGTVPQIRALVLQWESERGLPHSLMKHDRAGWSLRGGRDSGTPFPGMWKIEASGGALVLVGPTTFWRAEKGGRLRLRGRVRSGSQKGGRLQIVWKSLHPAGKEEGAPFEWHPHTELGQTAFDLGSKPGYTGGMVQLTLRFEGLVPGDAVEIESVGLEP